jgi:hypothetical protein
LDLILDREIELLERSAQPLLKSRAAIDGVLEKADVPVSLAHSNRLQLACEVTVPVEAVRHGDLEHGGRSIGRGRVRDVGGAASTERNTYVDLPLLAERRDRLAEGLQPLPTSAPERVDLATDAFGHLD